MIDTVLHFWFDALNQPCWFVKDGAFDRRVGEALLELHVQAAAGGLEPWKDSAAGCLALAILLDQVPRNVFRDSGRAFATDTAALALARHAVERGFDLELPVERRLFLYLPFEHSEDLEDQRRNLALVQERVGEAVAIDYAERHLRIIERFGRFPHRNQALGRVSSPEEVEFLARPGSSF